MILIFLKLKTNKLLSSYTKVIILFSQLLDKEHMHIYILHEFKGSLKYDRRNTLF